MSTDDILTRLRACLRGRYEVGGLVGTGATAIVFAAEDLKHERDVALKVLRPDVAAVVGASRFLAEIRTVAGLQHPHIVPLYDSGDADGLLYFAMPLVRGESLRARIDRLGELSVGLACSIARKTAAALHYAHERNVVHRDIKPANILLTTEDEPLVADFGLAIATASQHAAQPTGAQAVGTPLYVSPEQLMGRSPVSGQSDQFSLACVLYETLTGASPFPASSPSDLLRRLSPDVSDVRLIRPTVPEHVVHTLARSLERLPADRFDSMADFAAALEDRSFRFERLDAKAVLAEPAREQRRAGVGIKRLLAGTPLVALLMLLIWIGLNQATDDRGTDSFSLPRQGFHTVSGVTLAPNGGSVAIAMLGDTTAGIFIHNVARDQLSAVADTDGGRFPEFSPDGLWLAFRGADGSLMKVALGGGSPSTLVSARVVGPVSNPSWGSDRRILFTTPEGLFRVSELGGEPEALLRAASWLVYPRALLGGDAVLFTDGRDQSTRVLDLRNGSITILVHEAIDAVFLDASDQLLYSHPRGGLYVVPFDEKTLSVPGSPRLVVDSTSVSGRAQFSVSRSGDLLYSTDVRRASASPPRLMLEAPLGGEPRSLGLAATHFESPRWSPDGSSVAYAGGPDRARQIHVFDVATQVVRRITVMGDNTYPVWAPDGSALVFSSVRGRETTSDLYVRRLADDEHASLVSAPDGPQNAQAWLRGGGVVYESGPHPTGLWLLDPANGRSKVYLRHRQWDFDDIAVSPDGRWAAYQSDENGDEAVFVREFPDPGPRLRVSVGEGQFPRWSPDGQTLYYWLSADAEVDSLVSAAIDFGPPTRVTSYSVILVGDFDPEHWDLHPGGKKALVARRYRGERAEDLLGEKATFRLIRRWGESNVGRK